MTITQESFEYVATLVRSRSAISLHPGKEYLVESRLAPLAKRAGLSVDEYVGAQRRSTAPSEAEVIVEAMTTNETSWFRDVQPFKALTEHVVPEILRARPSGPLRIWSAACSTGQEPYSIAMSLAESLPPSAPRAEIVATDLSGEVLKKASDGVYSQIEINRGLPAPLLVKYFERRGGGWAVAPALRSTVRFAKHNLLHLPPAGGPFDVVFLRNVLIYFEPQTKSAILDRVRSVLRPEGFLILGAAETTIGERSAWTRCSATSGSVYQLAPGGTL